MKRIVVFALILNAALLGVIAHQLVAIAGGGAVATQNGDTNGDGSRDITDAVYLLSWLFQGGAEPVAIAQEGGNDEAIEELREQIAELQSGSRLANTAIGNNRDVIAALRTDLHPVAFSGDFEELENVPAAQGGGCCEQAPRWMVDILRANCVPFFFLGAGLTGLNFEGEDLRNVSFGIGDLNGLNFRNADLRGANFSANRSLDNVDFRGANLEGAAIPPSVFSGNFEGVDLREAVPGPGWQNVPGIVEWWTSNFRDANLSGLDFTVPDLILAGIGGWMNGCNFSNAILRSANLQLMQMRCCDLTGANLEGANVQGVDFRGSIGVNLEGTVGTPAFMP